MSATNRGSVRSPRDYYPTPPWLTRAQLREVLAPRLKALGMWPPRVYEPACGESLAIVKVLQEEWPEAIIEYSDIITLHGGVDFLTASPEPIFDLIITNPPYTFAREFAERAPLWLRNYEDGIVSLMLRLGFLGTQGRAKWMRAAPPHTAITPKRPIMGVNKDGKPGSDASEYAWLTWPSWDPMIHILGTEDIEGR